MNWTEIAIIATIWLFAAGIGYLWHSYVAPWLTEHHLMEAATIAVQAAEAAFGRYHGEEKLQSALAYLNDHGWNINSDTVMAAINAAWVKLNMAQIDAGIKDASDK